MTQQSQWGTFHAQLAALLAAIPKNLDDSDYSVSSEMLLWIGRVTAIVESAHLKEDAIAIRIAADHLDSATRKQNASKILSIAFRCLARAERLAPVAAQGVFIAVGSAFDAVSAVSRVVGTATKRVLIVDPYMDQEVLTSYAALAPEKIEIRLLSDMASHRPGLAPAVRAWSLQYGAQRPLEARLAPERSLHDRLIMVDDNDVWLLTQSLKDFAKRSPATIQRVDSDAASMKIAAYADYWNNGSPI